MTRPARLVVQVLADTPSQQIMVLSDDSDGSFAESDSTDGFGPPGDEYDPAPNKRATRKQATSGRKQRKRSATVKIPLQAKVTTLATQAHENPERDIALERRPWSLQSCQAGDAD